MRRSSAPAPPAAAPAPSPSSGRVRARWPYAGGQGLLLLGALLVVPGSLLPWLDTSFGTFNGLTGGGMYTFAVSWIGVAGAVLRSRRAAFWHAAVTGVVCVALPLWQVTHVWSLGLGLPGATAGWRPGVGLAIVLLGGLLVLRAAWRLRGGR